MPFLYIIVGTFFWSVDTLIRYPLLSEISAERLVFYEHLLLTCVFLPYLIRHQFLLSALKKTDTILSFIVIGGLGSALSTIAFTKAFGLINPSLVILLQKLQPFIAISLSAFLLKEKIHSSFFKIAGFALFGVVLMSYEDLSVWLRNPDFSGSMLGYVLALIAVTGWGMSTVFGKRLSLNGLTNNQIMSGRFYFGLISIFIFITLQNPSQFTPPNSESLVKISILALLSGLLGMTFYYKGLSRIKAHQATIAELFFPLIAVIINWIALDKPLSLLQLTGGLILIISSLFVQKQL